ncbi:MAG TPA: SdrD B-like domain-containing protein, partial [Saprospiraceae bacterium]|nr:SdrD B-like domain-containing protein [Saprospiraceae bacterium]
MLTRIALSGITGLLVYWLLSGSLSTSQVRVNDKSQMDCELFIDQLIVGDCVYGPETNNTSLVLIAAFVSWEDLPPGADITVSFMGQTEVIDPEDISCPDFVTFIVGTDGNAYDMVFRSTGGTCTEIVESVQLPDACNPPVCNPGMSTGGKLFTDFNDNGIQDASEPGIPNVPVRLYANNQLLGIAFTGVNGAWATDAIPPGTPLRIEFDVPSGQFDGGTGTESQTRVQIEESGNCSLSLGIYATRTVIDEDPWIASTCFAKGNNTDPNLPGAQEPTLVLNRYSTTTGGPRLGPNGNYYLANAYETGS